MNIGSIYWNDLSEGVTEYHGEFIVCLNPQFHSNGSCGYDIVLAGNLSELLALLPEKEIEMDEIVSEMQSPYNGYGYKTHIDWFIWDKVKQIYVGIDDIEEYKRVQL